LYVLFRSLVLLGVIGFGLGSACSTLIDWWRGTSIAPLHLEPVALYTALMTALCGLLAWRHRRDWHRTGRVSLLLLTEARNARIDAVIVTGAPVETLPFDHVFYWDGLRRILDWLDAARMPSLHVCWGAQAAMHHYHGVEKHPLRRKRFGLYPHMPMGSGHGLLTGIDLPFHMPVSRQSETRLEDLVRRPGLRPVLTAPVAGVGLVRDRARPAVYCLNHPEYGPRRLPEEFARDRKAGREIDPPAGYDAGLRRPQVAGQTAARTLYRNWITEIAATDPRTSADVALDWLLRAQLSGSTAPAGSPCRLQ